MKPFERQQHIFNYLMTNGKTKVDELASHFHLTGATIRKDLTALEKQNKVLRTYGSVVVTQKILNKTLLLILKPMSTSAKNNELKKSRHLINEGDSIIFDAGSTVLQIIPNLTTFDNLSIMTNSLTIFNAVLQLNKSYNLLMSGGSFREKSASFHGYFAESVFIGSTFDTLFIGTDGLDLDVGLTTFNEVYRVSSLMCNAAKKIIVLADSSKFGRKTPNIVCCLEKIHTIVTDDKLPTEMKDKLIEKGIEVLIV